MIINDNSILITWEEPDELNGQLGYYKVVVYTGEEYNITRQFSAADRRELNLNDLCK